MAKVYWKQIAVGDMIEALVKPAISRIQIAKFAAASQDFNPLHVDEEYAKAEGFGGIFVHSQLVFGLVEEAILGLADNLEIRSISATFHKLVWPGDSLSAKGLVNNHYQKEHEHCIDLDVWVENQNQDVVLKGKATCVLEAEEKKR